MSESTPPSPGSLPSHADGVVAAPLLPGDPPRIGDFWLDARLTAQVSGVAYLAHGERGQVMLVSLAEGAAEDANARERFAGEVNKMHIDTVLARGGQGQDGGRLAHRFHADDAPVSQDGAPLAPWVALAWDGSPAAVAEADRLLRSVDISSQSFLGHPSGPDYELPWVQRTGTGRWRIWPLPWPGRTDRAGWMTMLVSWLLMILTAALALLIAVLLFQNQPPAPPPPPLPTTPPPSSSSSASPPPSGSPSPSSGSPSPSSGSPSPSSASPSPSNGSSSPTPSPSGSPSSASASPTPSQSGEPTAPPSSSPSMESPGASGSASGPAGSPTPNKRL